MSSILIVGTCANMCKVTTQKAQKEFNLTALNLTRNTQYNNIDKLENRKQVTKSNKKVGDIRMKEKLAT